jgi:hypothetical protein
MAKVTLDEVLEGMKALAPDEQRKLWEALNTFLESSPPPSLDDELQQKLLAAGLFSEIRPPVADLESYRSYKPVEVRSKPVSETLIEERR